MEKEYKKIVDLERMYFDKIWDIMSSPDFIKDLREVSEFIQNNYKQLSDFWGEKNKVKIAVERLIRFHSYKKLNVIGIYPSPLSSDMAIVTEDCVINIDAKTIDMNGNAGDDTSIHFQKNQITFDNIPFFKQNIEGLKYHGIPFTPFLNPDYKGKPVLSFFLTVNYDDNFESFKLKHLSLCIVPHKIIVEVEHNNDIISNYKTYDYINKEQALLFNNPKYMPRNSKDNSWVELQGARNSTIYFDKSLEHPIFKNTQCGWKKISEQYKIVVYGGSARIPKGNLTNRLSSNGESWLGFKRLELS
jgi:hypothetical protein